MQRWKLSVIAVTFLTNASSIAFADVSLAMNVNGDESQKQTIQVSRGRVRMTSVVEGRTYILLFREGQDHSLLLDTASKKVITLAPRQIQKTLLQAAGVMQQLQAMMADQMKTTPPDQPAQIEQMIDRKLSEAPPPKPRMRTTKRQVTVGTWRCEIIEIAEGARTRSELCVAAAKSLGIAQEDFRTLQAFYGHVSSLADSLTQGRGQDNNPFQGVDALPGIPVRATYFRNARKEVMQLTRLSRDRLDEALFAVPRDYRRGSITSILGLLLR